MDTIHMRTHTHTHAHVHTHACMLACMHTHTHTKLSHVMAVYYIREAQQNVITSTPRGHNKNISLPEEMFFLTCNHIEKTIKDLAPLFCTALTQDVKWDPPLILLSIPSGTLLLTSKEDEIYKYWFWKFLIFLSVGY